MRNILILWIAMICLSALMLYAPQDKPDLRIGVLKTVDTVHPYIAEQQGYFKAEGLNVKIYSFGTSPALAEAFAAGELDIAYMSFAPSATWISKGVDMRIISGASRGGDIICVRNSMQKPNETIAVSKKGTMTETIYRGFIADQFQYTPIYGIECADMPTALLVTQDVDAALVWEPFATKIEDAGGACIFDAGKEWKKEYGSMYQRNVLVAKSRIFEDKGTLEKILRVHNKTIAILNSPGSNLLIAKVMNIEPLKEQRSEYNSSLDWESMKKIMEVAKSGGYLKEVLSYEELVYGG